SAPVPAAKLVDNYPDNTKSANPKTAKADKPEKKAKRTASLPPGFFLSLYQERKRPHPATLPARIIKRQFNPKAAALQLLEDQEKTTQRTLPPPKEVEEGEAEEDELEIVTKEPPRVLNKAQEDAVAISNATKAAYLNAKNYEEMDLLKSYLEQVISDRDGRARDDMTKEKDMKMYGKRSDKTVWKTINNKEESSFWLI
ncbi:hypothetical protein PTTG_30618, partial [Puccinia triticina 1-1 BBBD Race 1]